MSQYSYNPSTTYAGASPAYWGNQLEILYDHGITCVLGYSIPNMINHVMGSRLDLIGAKRNTRLRDICIINTTSFIPVAVCEFLAEDDSYQQHDVNIFLVYYNAYYN